jgi:hypothetical protein
MIVRPSSRLTGVLAVILAVVFGVYVGVAPIDTQSPSNATLVGPTQTILIKTPINATTTTIRAVIVAGQSKDCARYCMDEGFDEGFCVNTPGGCGAMRGEYKKDGNRYCPRTEEGLDRFCCCRIKYRL